MKVRTRLVAGFLALMGLFGGFLIYYQRVLDRSVETARDLASVDSRVLAAATTQLELVDRMEDDAAKYTITGDPGYYSLYRERRTAFADTLAYLRALDPSGTVGDAVDRLTSTWAAFEKRFPKGGDEDLEAALLLGMSGSEWNAFLTDLAAVRNETRLMRSTARGSVTSRLFAMSRGAEQASRTGRVTLAAALVLAVLLAFLIMRSITRPLARIERATAKIARGDFSTRVPVHGGSELSDLARRFNEMTDRLDELDRAKRHFLAHVSHDLKTPLASIREVQRVMLEGAAGELNGKQRRLTELGLANAERLSTMISRILELSRLEAGVEEYDSKPLDLGALCRRTVERFAPNGVPEVELTEPPHPITVRADRGALERVLENLLENARAHAGGTKIDVEVSRAAAPEADGEARALVTVRDRGPGLDEEDLDTIFRSFSAGREGTAPGHQGLGLAICREIVAAHEGRIWARNAPDDGSLFGFELPLAAADETSAVGAEDRTEEEASSRGASRRAAAAALGVAALLAAGCGSGNPPPANVTPVTLPPVEEPAAEEAPAPALPPPHPFHVLYEEGDWAEAAAAFEADPALLEDERALFRAGLIYAMPEGAAFDPERASTHLALLLEREPESDYAGVARVVLDLMARLSTSSTEVAALREQLERLKAVDLKDPPFRR